jgi:hypothetical protein
MISCPQTRTHPRSRSCSLGDYNHFRRHRSPKHGLYFSLTMRRLTPFSLVMTIIVYYINISVANDRFLKHRSRVSSSHHKFSNLVLVEFTSMEEWGCGIQSSETSFDDNQSRLCIGDLSMTAYKQLSVPSGRLSKKFKQNLDWPRFARSYLTIGSAVHVNSAQINKMRVCRKHVRTFARRSCVRQ